MRFWEIIADKLADTAIFEMAFDRKSAKEKITSISPQLIKHISKLFIFDSPENKNHWMTEINSWIEQIYDIRLKPNNKHPDKNTLYTWIVFDSAPHYNAEFIDKMVRILKKVGYSNVPSVDYDSEFVINKVLSIIDKICHDISNDEFNTIDEYF